MAFKQKSFHLSIWRGAGGGGGQAYLDNVQIETIFFSLKASLIPNIWNQSVCPAATVTTAKSLPPTQNILLSFGCVSFIQKIQEQSFAYE